MPRVVRGLNLRVAAHTAKNEAEERNDVKPLWSGSLSVSPHFALRPPQIEAMPTSADESLSPGALTTSPSRREDDEPTVSVPTPVASARRCSSVTCGRAAPLPPAVFPGVLAHSTQHRPDEKSLEAWAYINSHPGKNVRDHFIEAFQPWFRVPEDRLVLIKEIVGMLHSASLIVDDIEDRSTKRRGFDAAHIIFGEGKALNAANYVYFLALEKVLILQSTAAVEAYTKEMLNLHRGQGRDIWWRVDGHVPTPEAYDDMVRDKTGGLLRLAARLLACAVPTGTPPANTHLELCDAMAVYFQIRDDVINVASPKFHLQKGFCDDVQEGKLSFLVITAVRTLREDGRAALGDELLAILKSQTADVDKKRRAVEIMRAAGAVDAALVRLAELRTRIDVLTEQLGGSDAMRKIMAALDADLDDCRASNDLE